MTDTTHTSSSRASTGAPAALVQKAVDLLDAIPKSLVLFLMRLTIAVPFWQSGRTKVEGLLSLKSSTFYLFQYEYDLPVIPHTLAAYMATYAEHLFPVLLVIGLATRFSALALLVMTAVIQIFVYPDAWKLHSYWAIILLAIVSFGPGRLSVDHLIKQRYGA